ncbi:MAG: transcription elongation factor GreA [Elusimicrobia bacterium]|nr:transcription elongation factor GreA [Candidatus Liberimonas magnetica]
MSKEIYLTREGYAKLNEELERLKKRKPQISKDIGTAREMGDLKENAEYHAAKETLGHLVSRIAELEDKIARSKIIDEQNIAKDTIYIGATVTLEDIEEKDEFAYTIVDIEEANPGEGKISVQSPLAQGLLGHKVGETLEVNLPGGKLNVKILKITR